MDSDAGFPSSSAPFGMGSELGDDNGTPTRRPTNALAIDDDDDDQANEEGPSATRRRRPRTQANGDVPLVTDEVGTALVDNFQSFLETYVLMPSLLASSFRPQIH